MILDLIKQYLNYLLAGVAVIILASACYLTYTVTDSHWQSKWDKRETEISDASAKATEQARTKEQEYQRSIDELRKQGASNLAAAIADANDASASVERLRQRINKILADTSTENSGTGVRGKTATQAANLLANVLEKSLERNEQLAKIADDNYERGLTCEKSWDALLKNQGN